MALVGIDTLQPYQDYSLVMSRCKNKAKYCLVVGGTKLEICQNCTSVR